MRTGKLFVAGALVFALSVGLAQAKIPVAPMDDAAKAKAAQASAQKAEGAKKNAAALAKAQDRVVEWYKKGQAKGGTPMAADKK